VSSGLGNIHGNSSGGVGEGFEDDDDDDSNARADPNEVRFEERFAFARALLDSSIQARAGAAESIMAGLGRMLPLPLLRLFRWRSLKRLVCGRDTIDLRMLRRHTKYLYCDDTDDSVVHFWTVLGSMTQDQQATFI